MKFAVLAPDTDRIVRYVDSTVAKLWVRTGVAVREGRTLRLRPPSSAEEKHDRSVTGEYMGYRTTYWRDPRK
jgi:hypothetical protein